MKKSSLLPSLKLILANPRGFCAGVDRAVQIVEQALIQYGAPVYVRHEIVHNHHVINRLASQGAVFVDELSEIPEGACVVFSAHGVAKSVPEEAKRRNQFVLDATCPLVSKVHIEAERLYAQGRYILLIGHAGHPEIIGTMGQLPPNAMSLIETVHDAQIVTPPFAPAYLTQTTLAIDDTAAIIQVLKTRFPDIVAPPKQDICYATTNRQNAVKKLAHMCNKILVIGASNSSNACRLVEVAAQITPAQLISTAADIDWTAIEADTTIGLTAGASKKVH